MIESEYMFLLGMVQDLGALSTADEISSQCNGIIEAVAALRDRKVRQIMQDEIDEHTVDYGLETTTEGRTVLPEPKEN